MKKRIYTILAAIIILTVGPNAYADGNEKAKENKESKAKAEKIVNRISERIDAELSLENWMTRVSDFNSKESFNENELVLEAWMTESFESSASEFVDEELSLDGWMTSPFAEETAEEELQIEDWMESPFSVEQKSIDEELVLENWMIRF